MVMMTVVLLLVVVLMVTVLIVMVVIGIDGINDNGDINVGCGGGDGYDDGDGYEAMS